MYSDLKPQIFDGHNGNAAAIFSRENLLNHILGAIPRGIGREEWLQALPRALVAGFVKTDKEFQSRGVDSGLYSSSNFFWWWRERKYGTGGLGFGPLLLTDFVSLSGFVQEKLLELQPHL